MSFFSKVFGGKKEAAAPSTAEAIQKLRETEDMLIKKQDFLETKIENEMMVAKKNASKNKRGSITILIACCLSSFKFQSYFYDLSIRTVSQWWLILVIYVIHTSCHWLMIIYFKYFIALWQYFFVLHNCMHVICLRLIGSLCTYI